MKSLDFFDGTHHLVIIFCLVFFCCGVALEISSVKVSSLCLLFVNDVNELMNIISISTRFDANELWEKVNEQSA